MAHPTPDRILRRRQRPQAVTAYYPSGNLLQRAVAVLRDEGFGNFVGRGLSRLGYRRLLLLERPLADPVPEPACALRVSMRRLDPREEGEYLGFRPETPRSIVAKRWQSGDICFVAQHEGRIISTCWVSGRKAWSEYLGCEIERAAGEAYLYDAFTLSEHRGQGVAPALCGYQLGDLRRDGYARAIRCTMPENKPALRAHAKTGFHPVAMLVSIGVGPWHTHFRRRLDGGR